MSLDATRWAWTRTFRRPTAKLVLLSLADRAGEQHTAYPSIARLEADTGLDRKTIMAVLAWLEAEGYIKSEKATGKGTHYTLLGVSSREDEHAMTSPKNGTSAGIGTSPKNGTTPVPKTGPLPVPKTGHESTNESTKNREEGAKPKKPLLDFSILPPDIDPALLSDYLTMRRTAKCPVSTQTTVKGIARDLEACRALGYLPDAVISLAVERNWRGLKPEWVSNALSTNQPTGVPHGTYPHRLTAAERGERLGAEYRARLEAHGIVID